LTLNPGRCLPNAFLGEAFRHVSAIDQRCRKIFHFHGLLDISQLQRDVYAVLFIDAEPDAGRYELLKPGQGSLDSISTDWERQYPVLTRSISSSPLDEVRVQIDRRNFNTRQNCHRGVFDDAKYGSCHIRPQTGYPPQHRDN